MRCEGTCSRAVSKEIYIRPSLHEVHFALENISDRDSCTPHTKSAVKTNDMTLVRRVCDMTYSHTFTQIHP